MRRKTFEGMACSFAGAVEAIGDSWGFLILRDLLIGLQRFEEIQESLGIATDTLSKRLKALQSSGLVMREPYSQRPVRHRYLLTPKGRDLFQAVIALNAWGDRWGLSGREGPPIRLVNAETDNAIELALLDSVTGARVQPAAIRMAAGPGADDVVINRFETARQRKQAA
jgi:DNA-binding HxlR family transcriptional regulator